MLGLVLLETPARPFDDLSITAKGRCEPDSTAPMSLAKSSSERASVASIPNLVLLLSDATAVAPDETVSLAWTVVAADSALCISRNLSKSSSESASELNSIEICPFSSDDEDDEADANDKICPFSDDVDDDNESVFRADFDDADIAANDNAVGGGGGGGGITDDTGGTNTSELPWFDRLFFFLLYTGFVERGRGFGFGDGISGTGWYGDEDLSH